jgi:hypothetical protein
MSFRKGQAALDFLMTYGWAIALVVIIAAVLFALGIFDVSNFVGSKAAGFSGVAVQGWKLGTDGTFSLKLSNQVGQLISVNSVNVTIGQNNTPFAQSLWTVQTVPFQLSPGASSGTMTSPTAAYGVQTNGGGYTAKVTIGYTDLNSNFNYTTTGTLTGKAS